MVVTHYEILQVREDASTDVLNAAARELMRRYHPDNQDTGDEETFKRVQQAAAVLRDPQSRRAYDLCLAQERNARRRRPPQGAPRHAAAAAESDAYPPAYLNILQVQIYGVPVEVDLETLALQFPHLRNVLSALQMGVSRR